jgi:hypothetical protein
MSAATNHLPMPSDLPSGAIEFLRLWSTSASAQNVLAVSRWPEWTPMQAGESIAAAAANYLHQSETRHRDSEKLRDESEELRAGFGVGLSRAHLARDPQQFDDWGCPFKARFTEPGAGHDSVLATEYPELFARICDDETAIVYDPKCREFAIPVLDGGPSAVRISHDPFSGKSLPAPLGDAWFTAIEAAIGRPYRWDDRTLVPDEFRSEAWWIARGL